MVRDPRPPEPGPPEPDRGRDARLRLLDALRRDEPVGPGEAAVGALALRKHVPAADAVSLDPEQEVRAEADRNGRAVRVRRVAVVADERPLRGRAPVVEGGLAEDLDLDATLDTPDGAHEHVVAVVVGRGPRVRRDLVVARVRPHRQRVPHLDPALRRLPGRDEDVRARLVLTGGRMVDPVRRDPEEPGLSVEQAAEDARRVEGGDA